MKPNEEIILTLLIRSLSSLPKSLSPSETLVCSYSKHLSAIADRFIDNLSFIDIISKEYDKIITTFKTTNEIYVSAANKLPKNISPTSLEIEKAILDAKENWVTGVLEEYFKKWIWYGTIESGEYVTIPYYINKRENNKDNKQKEFTDIRTSYKDYAVNRDKYDYQSYRTHHFGNGKAFPELLTAVAEDIFKKESKDKVSARITSVIEKMKKAYIGIDCSGFVSRALATIFQKLCLESEEQFSSLGPDDDDPKSLRTNMSHYAYDNPEIEKDYIINHPDHVFSIPRCKNINGKWTMDKANRIDVTVLATRIRPGDYLHKLKNNKNETGHVIIISEVVREHDEIVSFTTMESCGTDTTIELSNAKINNIDGVIKKTFYNNDRDSNMLFKINTKQHTITIEKNEYRVMRAPILKNYYNVQDDMLLYFLEKKNYTSI